VVAAGKGRGDVEDDEERMPQALEARAQMAVRKTSPNLVPSVVMD
jgi:hypothetical protein